MNQPAEGAPRYDLYTRDGQSRFFWRLTDHGISFEPDGLLIYRAGQWTRAPYDRIMSVGLSTGSAGRGNVIANCTITLTNGSRIVVSNVKASGISDLSRDSDYRHFVKDFHKALVASGPLAIFVLCFWVVMGTGAPGVLPALPFSSWKAP